MSDLKDQLIKLGNENPDLQDNLRSVLDTLSKTSQQNEKQLIKGELLDPLGLTSDVKEIESLGGGEFNVFLNLDPTFRNVKRIIRNSPAGRFDEEALREDLKQDPGDMYPSGTMAEIYPDILDRRGPVQADLRVTEDQIVLTGKLPERGRF